MKAARSHAPALALAGFFWAGTALADKPEPAPKAEPPAASAEASAEAQTHFQRAKDLYQAGSYREAYGELEAARDLDPRAKELVFNLGVVAEKLARFDDAITHFTAYLEMEGVAPAERAKAEANIKRLEGAKREATPAGPGETPARGGGTEAPAEPAPRASGGVGRIDAATVAAASVAVVGLGVGLGFGIHALGTRPGEGFVAGRDGTYADLVARTDSAQRSALVADVGFAVAAASTIAAAYLYFGRSKTPARTGAAPSGLGAILPGLRPTAVVTSTGGLVGLGGAFR